MNARCLLAVEPALDRVGGVDPRLHGHLGDAGEVVERHHVADREHLGMAGQRAVVEYGDPAGAVARRPAGLCEQAGQRRRLHAGSPDLRPGRRLARSTRRLSARRRRRRRRPVTTVPVRIVTPSRSQLLGRLLGEPVAERRKDLLAAVDEHDLRLRGVDAAEVAA